MYYYCLSVKQSLVNTPVNHVLCGMMVLPILQTISVPAVIKEDAKPLHQQLATDVLHTVKTLLNEGPVSKEKVFTHVVALLCFWWYQVILWLMVVISRNGMVHILEFFSRCVIIYVLYLILWKHDLSCIWGVLQRLVYMSVDEKMGKQKM